jgi:hypothetical protein
MADDFDLLFDRLLENAQDITDTYEVDLGGLPDVILETTRDTQPIIEAVREGMEQFRTAPGQEYRGKPMLIDMEVWASRQAATVQELLRTGKVAAIDGTPLMRPQRYLAGQVYACAVGDVTSMSPLRLRAQLVKTIVPLNIKGKVTKADVDKLIESSEQLLSNSSWPNAFMEYQERDYALRLDAPYILLDGPICPENVITRKSGRSLVADLLKRSDRTFVGVIKSLTNSSAMYRMRARALRPGELYIVETESEFLLRNADENRFTAYHKWVEEDLGCVLRGIYRPGSKTFGFQCHIKDLDMAIALLWWDRDRVPGHEIPFLLNQVDQQIRARYHGIDTSAVIDGLLSQQGEDYFFDEANERDLR